MLKSYNTKRVKFVSKTKQKEFFELVKTRSNKTNKEIALVNKVNPHQISEWKTAKNTIPLYVFKKLLKLAKIQQPKGTRVIGRYDHIQSAAKKGGIATFKKYGKIPHNEENRRVSWEKWWKTFGKYQKRKILERKPIKIPQKSTELAELCGILIGDGGISKYQVRITLNGETDKMYSKFVVKLLSKLFGVKPMVYKIKNKKAVNICISRSDLVDFLIKNDLRLGNKLKQNLSIPMWILKSQKYLISCIRGMVDTDGCVVRETHNIKTKKYMYYRLNFTSFSPTLIDETFQALEMLGFHPKIRTNGKAVQLENMTEICDYFKRVGTHNPKHINRLGGIG